jgi:hypothetical protein
MVFGDSEAFGDVVDCRQSAVIKAGLDEDAQGVVGVQS